MKYHHISSFKNIILFMRKNEKKKFISIFIILIAVISIGFHSLKYENQKKPNVILIIVDSLRADHLGCYGYGRDITPHIDKLSQEGVLFLNAFSQAGYTLASIPSILTSKFPLSHGVFYGMYKHKLSNKEFTLAKILKKKGYFTVGFQDGLFPSRTCNFTQGFDIYFDVAKEITKDINQLVSDWLEHNKKEPFFLFLHYNTVHDPFNPPDSFNSTYALHYQGHLKEMSLDHLLFEKIDKGLLKLDKTDIDYIIAQYDGCIRLCDKYIGDLLKKIEEKEFSSNAVVILTADHGEDLMEHGTISHGDVYDVGIHIPLIFRYPNLFPRDKRINVPVRSIDILPTILDILGLSIREDMEGFSLLPLIIGKDDKEEWEQLIFSFGVNMKSMIRISLRTQNWKLIFTSGENKYELYDLKNDPKELNNLVSIEKERFESLKKKFNENIFSIENEKSVIKPNKFDKRTLSLGYIQ
jgi:arylsulfatase A-like enzyme